MPGTVLAALHVSYLIFPATLHSRCSYPHFRSEEAKVPAMIFFMALGPADRTQLEESYFCELPKMEGILEVMFTF